MAVRTAAGTRIFIGPANEVANDVTAYELLSYTEVGEVENASEIGDTFNPSRFKNLNDRRDRTLKGSKDGGSLDLRLGDDGLDAGQIAMLAASGSDGNFAFKIESNDGTTSPTTFFFRALVMSYKRQIGDAESILMVAASLAVNSDVVEKAAI